jgi:hypothetical protein
MRLIPVLLFVILISGLSTAQQNEPARSKRKELEDCTTDNHCFKATAYIATLTDAWESVTPQSRLVRLILSFENVSERPIILAYRAHSIFVLDNLSDRYFCCQSQNSADSSAMGIGTDDGNKMDTQFLLIPHEKRIASFDVWTFKANPPASYYNVDVQIDEIDPTDRDTLQLNPYLSFRNVVPSAQRKDQHGVTPNR